MGTTADKLNKLLETKQAIKQAIIDKGVEIEENTVFADYPAKINAIQAGGGEISSDNFFNLRTNNGTNLSNLFYSYSGSELDLSTLDTSKATTMNSMFDSCGGLMTLDISNFNTDNVNTMTRMFNNCSGLTELDLSNFNTSRLFNMNQMFSNCFGLQILNLSNFDLTGVFSPFLIFGSCNNLRELRLDNCNNDTISKLFKELPTGAIEGVTKKVYCKQANVEGLYSIENWIVIDSETGEQIMLQENPIPPGSKLYEPYEFSNNYDITEANVMVLSENTALDSMFYNCNNLNTIHNIDKWDTSNVTTMNNMFYCCWNLTSLDLSSFITSSLTDTSYMFDCCTQLETLNMSNFDLTNVGNATGMFQSCNMLWELRLDNCSYDTINKIITSEGFPTDSHPIEGITRKIYVKAENVADLTPPTNWKFIDEYGNEIIPEGGETIEPEIPLYEVGQFTDNKDITEVNVMVNDTHTDLSSMFSGCYNLTTIHNMDKWDTSNVTNISRMFYYCQALVSIDLSGLDISNVTTMDSAFHSCSALTTIIGEIDASKISKGILANNFGDSLNPFKGCTSLETLYIKNIYKDITTMKNEKKWSIDLSKTKVKDECLVYIINELPDLINDKGLTATDQIVFTLPPTNTLTQEQVQVALDKGWQVANTTY